MTRDGHEFKRLRHDVNAHGAFLMAQDTTLDHFVIFRILGDGRATLLQEVGAYVDRNCAEHALYLLMHPDGTERRAA